MLLNCGAGEDLRVSWTAGRSNQVVLKEINPEYSLEGLMVKLKSNTLATWCEELTYWKRPWCWGRLRVRGEGGNRGWDGWMASSTQWTWIWANSGRQWRTGKPGGLQPMGLRTQLSDWTTDLLTQKSLEKTMIWKTPWSIEIHNRINTLIKDPGAGKDWRQKEKRAVDDELVR